MAYTYHKIGFFMHRNRPTMKILYVGDTMPNMVDMERMNGVPMEEVRKAPFELLD